MLQRKNINYHLRNNEPLPLPEQNERRRLAREDHEDRLAYKIMLRASTARKRPLQHIINSGAFDVEKYVPRDFRESCERSKAKLQASMSGFPESVLDSMNVQVRNRRRLPSYEDNERANDPVAQRKCLLSGFNHVNTNSSFLSVLSEIYDRADWLAEMEELGEGKKHRIVIHAQIAEKLREIKKIQKKHGLKGSSSSATMSSAASTAGS